MGIARRLHEMRVLRRERAMNLVSSHRPRISHALLHLPLLVACCVLGARPAHAVDASALLIHTVLPDKFHDSLRYRRVSATKYPDGRRTKREYLATIEVTVRGHRGDSTMLAWKYTNMSLNGESLADLPLELSVSRDGDLELLNVDDLQRKVLQAASVTAKASRPLDFGGDELAKMAANKEALSFFYLRDAMIFFYPQGTTMRRDRPVEFDSEIHGLGGDTLKAVDSWTILSEHDAPAGTIPIKWKQDFDRRDVERYFSALGKAVGINIAADKGLLTKKGLYALDRTTFWPNVVFASTKVSTQDGYEQFDAIEIRSSMLDPNWKH